MFKSILLSSAVLLAVLYPHHEADAQARCPAGYSGCTFDSVWTEFPKRAVQGAHDVLRNPYRAGRRQEVIRTLDECWSCARDGYNDGISRVTGSRIGGYTPRRSSRGAQ